MRRHHHSSWPRAPRCRLVLGPDPLVLGSAGLIVVGIAMAGLVDVVPLWLVGFALAGLGAGASYTRSAGVLFQAVGEERIVTALVVWSQLGIVGYLLGPLAGGAVGQGLDFPAIGLVPADAWDVCEDEAAH